MLIFLFYVTVRGTFLRCCVINETVTIQDDDVDVKKQKTENGHDAENGEDEEDAEEEEDLGEEEEDLDGEGEDELDEEDGGEGEYSTQSWGQIRTHSELILHEMLDSYILIWSNSTILIAEHLLLLEMLNQCCLKCLKVLYKLQSQSSFFMLNVPICLLTSHNQIWQAAKLSW